MSDKGSHDEAPGAAPNAGEVVGGEMAALLSQAAARQEAGDSAEALALYERALQGLEPGRFPGTRARVLFHTAQLCRYEGQAKRALSLYDDLLALSAKLADSRAHGLARAMKGQLIFLGGAREDGLVEMVRGLEELRTCGAEEAGHLTCHTRYFSRRMERGQFEECVRRGTTDEALRALLLSSEPCE
jgi:tetratricopeptide (TPR) repeat protein